MRLYSSLDITLDNGDTLAAGAGSVDVNGSLVIEALPEPAWLGLAALLACSIVGTRAGRAT